MVKECPPVTKEEADQKIKDFLPTNTIALEMYECI